METNQSKKILLSESTFLDIVKGLAKKIRESEEYSVSTLKYIVAPSRGGLIPAVHLSHLLNLPLIVLEKHELTSLKSKVEFRYSLDNDEAEQFENIKIILVEDISDTGKTFQTMLSGLNSTKNVITASLVCRGTTSFSPDFFGNYYIGNSWVVFPWEHKPIINKK